MRIISTGNLDWLVFGASLWWSLEELQFSVFSFSALRVEAYLNFQNFISFPAYTWNFVRLKFFLQL